MLWLSSSKEEAAIHMQVTLLGKFQHQASVNLWPATDSRLLFTPPQADLSSLRAWSISISSSTTT
jgi:hypothetical protein